MKSKLIFLLSLLSLISYSDLVSRQTVNINIYSDAYIENELDRIVQSKLNTMTFTNVYNNIDNYDYSTNVVNYYVVTNSDASVLMDWNTITNKPENLKFDTNGYIKVSSISTTDDSGRLTFGEFINPVINFNNLMDKPIIPDKISQLNNDLEFLTADSLYRSPDTYNYHISSGYIRVNPYSADDDISISSNGGVAPTIDDSTGTRSMNKQFRTLQAAWNYSCRSGDNIMIMLLVKNGETKDFYLNLESASVTAGRIVILSYDTSREDNIGGTARIFLSVSSSLDYKDIGIHNSMITLGGSSSGRIKIGLGNSIPVSNSTNFKNSGTSNGNLNLFNSYLSLNNVDLYFHPENKAYSTIVISNNSTAK